MWTRIVAKVTLPHDRDRGLTDAEELRIGIVDAHANGETRREVHPVERTFDVGQAVGELRVLGQDSVADAFDMAVEAAVGMAHEIDVDVRADGDVFELGLAVVGDDIPGARVDEGEQGRARMSVGSDGDVHAGDVGVEGSDDAGAFEIEPGAVHLRCQGGTLRLWCLDAVDGVDGLAQLRLGLGGL